MKLSEFIEDINDFLHNFLYRVKHFFSKIIKIFSYLPILWKDEDWDFEFLIILMEHKIKRMHKCLKKNNIIEENELNRTLDSMDKALQHINNYIHSDEVYEEKFGESSIKTSLDTESHEVKIINSETGKELTEKEDKIYIDYIMDKYHFEQQEWEHIFDTIKEYGQKWWD